MKIRTFCFFAAFGATIFACSGKSSDVSSPTDTSSEDLVTAVCGKGACGPELGMPAIKCDDGSIGGNTGECVETKANPVCHWLIRKCPAPVACDCGPAPLLADAKCWDGSVSGPVCGPLPPAPVAGGSGGGTASGGTATPGAPPPAGTPAPAPVPDPGTAPPPPSTCGWYIKPCPPPPPPPPPVCDCGPAPALAKMCPDGSTSKTVCVDTAPGKCSWQIECPPSPTPLDCSAPGACGPALGLPNYLCPDGKTVAGPGPCVDQGGKCGWEIISCPK